IAIGGARWPRPDGSRGVFHVEHPPTAATAGLVQSIGFGNDDGQLFVNDASPREAMSKKSVYMVASGDLRESANLQCEAAQQEMEKSLSTAVKKLGGNLKRAHGFRKDTGHSFI